METIRYTVHFQDAVPGDEGDVLVLPEQKAWFPDGPGSDAPINWWQYGGEMSRNGTDRANAVYACRAVISQDVSRLPAYHYRREKDGGETRLRSTLGRVLRYPNEWQTAVEFWLNMVDRMLTRGNAYAYIGTDDRGALSSLTPLRDAHPFVDPKTRTVFYGVGLDSSSPLPDAEEMDVSQLVPQRYILHLRAFTPVHPLMGESPLVAAAVSANTGTAITNSNFQIFNRAARPSGYLRHPKRISQEARKRLAKAWADSYSGSGVGGTAVLEEGLEWQPLTMTAVDSEIIDSYNLTVRDIARVFRVPMHLLGELADVNFNSIEQLTRVFVSGGLGFYLRMIEERVAQSFGLSLDEGVRFDVEAALLRAEFKDRMDGLTKGVQGAVYTPNEARRREGLPEVPFGDQPIVQQQMVPLSAAAQQTLPGAPGSAPAAPPDNDEEPPTPEETRALVRQKMKAA